MTYGKVIKEFKEDGRQYRLTEYKGFGIAREAYSPQTGKWYHQYWTK